MDDAMRLVPVHRHELHALWWYRLSQGGEWFLVRYRGEDHLGRYIFDGPEPGGQVWTLRPEEVFGTVFESQPEDQDYIAEFLPTLEQQRWNYDWGAEEKLPPPPFPPTDPSDPDRRRWHGEAG